MLEEIKVTAHIKGNLDVKEWGIYIDGKPLEEIFREALKDEAVDSRPSDIWIGITLEAQGVEYR